MNISDVYANNDKIHERTKQLVGQLDEQQSAFLPVDEKWTLAHLVEHLAIVQEGMAKISAKLLNEAQKAGKQSDGAANLSEGFIQKTAEARKIKLEAPDRVRPTGNQTIEESLKKMDENQQMLKDLRPLFESVECSEFTFPHPFLGDLTAHEWLTLVGGHEGRHHQQIESMIEKAGKREN